MIKLTNRLRTATNDALIAKNELMKAALGECVDVLTDPIVGTFHHDDPDWYMRLDKAVAIARAALTDGCCHDRS